MKIFYPDLYVKTVFDIDYSSLKNKKIDTLMFDIDNTLACMSDELPSDEIIHLFNELSSLGFKLCLVSNNTEDRVRKFAEPLGQPFVHFANKPLKSGFKKALALCGAAAIESAIIGDQLFTDVWGGKRMGMYRILVDPISKEMKLFFRLKRILERWIMNGLK